LYHHFADKPSYLRGLRAGRRELAARLGEAIIASNQTDPVTSCVGVDFWLDASSDPEVQRIVLVDAPACWVARWTEIGNRYNIGFVRDLLPAPSNRRIPPQRSKRPR